MKNINSRFKGAPWILPTESDAALFIPYSMIYIGGAGGIGSWTTLFLSRAGFYTYVQDFDEVEEHNVGGQFYNIQSMGQYKVHALQNLISAFTGNDYICSSCTIAVDEQTEGHLFMISAFDNMKARKDYFASWKRAIENSIDPLTSKDSLFIDGRLSMEGYEIYCVTPDKIEEYEETLFADEEVEEAPCSMKQTTHVAAMIGSQITSLFTNHVTNIRAGKAIRSVPFKYTFFTPLFCN